MSKDCLDLKEELSCYLDGMLDNVTSKQVANHLTECDNCRQEYIRLKAISHLLEKGTRLAVPSLMNLWPDLIMKLPNICDVVVEDMSACFDGELPMSAQEGIREHLHNCEQCKNKFQQLNCTNKFIASFMQPSDIATVDLWSGIKSRLNEDCTLIANELSVYVDQEVAPLRHRTITSHILECLPCKQEFVSLSCLGDLICNHYQPDLPENFELWPAIQSAINVIPINTAQKKTKNTINMATYRQKRLMVVGLAILVIGFISFVFLHNLSAKRSIQPISAEAYLLEQSLMEPVENAEAVVYENQ